MKLSVDFSLKPLSFVIDEQTLVCLCGSSGSGKSTILNLIAGIHHADSGSILFEPVKPLIHYVVVDDNTVESLSVFDNLRLSCGDEQKIQAIIEEIGLSEVAAKHCSSLSKGEQERVAIARGLISAASVLLLDEPTANLDSETSEAIFALLKKYAREKTIIVASHDVELAAAVADQMIYIEQGELIKIENLSISSSKNTDSAQTKDNFPWRTYLKLAAKTVFSKKISYIISAVLLVLSLLSLFSGIAYLNIDDLATVKQELNSFKSDYLPISDRDCGFKFDEYVSKKNLARDDAFATLSLSGSARSLAVALYEDVNSFIDVGVDLTTYVSPIPNNINVHYYPIALSDSLVDLMARDDESYSIGSVIPYTFYYGEPLKVKFIVASFFTVETERRDLWHGYFPGVISREAYIDLIEHNGVSDGNASDALDKALIAYYTYCTENSIENRIKEQSLVGYSSNLTNSADVEVVRGRKPMNENEVMVATPLLYDIFAADGDRTQAEEDFFAPYVDGYWVEESVRHDLPKRKIKIVGLYSSNSRSENLAVDPDTFNRLHDMVITDPFLNSGFKLYLRRQYLLDHVEELLEEGRYMWRMNLIDIPFMLEVRHSHVTIMMVISGMFFLMGVLTLLLYINGCLKKNYRNIALLDLIGKSRWQRTLFYLMILGVILVIPTVVTLIASYPVSHYVSTIFIGFVLGKGAAVMSRWQAFLVLLGAIAAIVVLFYPVIYLIGRKKTLKYLKEE